MKRNSLTTALLAGLAGVAGLASTAQALNLNPDGLGSVLIYPYYTVNKSNQTLISVVNTQDEVKAVKVRFLEGRNSREVLDFNLYLSPYDVWVAAIYAPSATSAATLITPDTSCTVPKIPTAGVAFKTAGFSGAFDDNGGTTVARTREGHIEMIEMGTVGNPYAAAATHDDGVPDDCQFLVDSWSSGGGWTDTNGADSVSLPTGGLYGAGTIVDVPNGTLHAYNADAIEGFYRYEEDPARLHSDPGSTFPSLADATDDDVYSTSYVFGTLGSLVISRWDSNLATPNSVSSVYMHDAIFNEFVTDPALGAASEWVITFPTKRFYVDVTSDASTVRPFTEAFRDDAAPNGKSCELIALTLWDREELSLSGFDEPIFSPPDPTNPNDLTLCYEAQVLTFNQEAAVSAGASKIFGSTYARNVNAAAGVNGSVGVANGHARIDFTATSTTGSANFRVAHRYTSDDGDVYEGLPVTGFWSANYVNANAAPGKLANYSGAYRHRASRDVADNNLSAN